jgi:biopolymer transport protein ExbB
LFSIIQAAGWPIWPLILCSIVALALVIERLISLRPERVVPNGLLDQVITVSESGLPSAQAQQQLAEHSVLGRVLASGFEALRTHPFINETDLRASLEASGRRAAHELERYLPALGTIASAAPLIGLLGTVVGMIDIFGSQSASGSNPILLAQGISMALYNTAFGLIVAIPSLMCWRYLRARVDAYVLSLELEAERFMRHLIVLRNKLN